MCLCLCDCAELFWSSDSQNLKRLNAHVDVFAGMHHCREFHTVCFPCFPFTLSTVSFSRTLAFKVSAKICHTHTADLNFLNVEINLRQ